jgi:hypothetical protein
MNVFRPLPAAASAVAFLLAFAAQAPAAAKNPAAMMSVTAESLVKSPMNAWARAILFSDTVAELPGSRSQKLDRKYYFPMELETAGTVWIPESCADDFRRLTPGGTYSFAGTVDQISRRYYIIIDGCYRLQTADDMQEQWIDMLQTPEELAKIQADAAQNAMQDLLLAVQQSLVKIAGEQGLTVPQLLAAQTDGGQRVAEQIAADALRDGLRQQNKTSDEVMIGAILSLLKQEAARPSPVVPEEAAPILAVTPGTEIVPTEEPEYEDAPEAVPLGDSDGETADAEETPADEPEEEPPAGNEDAETLEPAAATEPDDGATLAEKPAKKKKSGKSAKKKGKSKKEKPVEEPEEEPVSEPEPDLENEPVPDSETEPETVPEEPPAETPEDTDALLIAALTAEEIPQEFHDWQAAQNAATEGGEAEDDIAEIAESGGETGEDLYVEGEETEIFVENEIEDGETDEEIAEDDTEIAVGIVPMIEIVPVTPEGIAAHERARLAVQTFDREEMARLAEEREAAEKARIEEEKRLAAEEKRIEKERRTEEKRLERERREAERLAEKERIRLEREEQEAIEAARAQAEAEAARRAEEQEAAARAQAAERARIEAAKAAAEAQAARLEAIRQAEAERQAREIENRRLAAERESLREQARIEAETRKQLAAEAARLEVEQREAEKFAARASELARESAELQQARLELETVLSSLEARKAEAETEKIRQDEAFAAGIDAIERRIRADEEERLVALQQEFAGEMERQEAIRSRNREMLEQARETINDMEARISENAEALTRAEEQRRALEAETLAAEQAAADAAAEELLRAEEERMRRESEERIALQQAELEERLLQTAEPEPPAEPEPAPVVEIAETVVETPEPDEPAPVAAAAPEEEPAPKKHWWQWGRTPEPPKPAPAKPVPPEDLPDWARPMAF